MGKYGIYAYIDNLNNEIIYVGKDMRINTKRRHNEHYAPSRYDEQPINRILQNNPDRYTYQVLVWDVPDPITLNALEIQYISHLKPKFNFTNGGDGICGYAHTKDTKLKMSKAKKGKYLGYKHPFFGKKHSEESKRLQSINISKSNNKTGFYRVSIHNNTKNKQGFCYVYSYIEESKRKQISSADLDKLELKVKDKGLKWFKLEKEENYGKLPKYT